MHGFHFIGNRIINKKVTVFASCEVVINFFSNFFLDFYFFPSVEHLKLGTGLATKNCHKNA